MRKKNEEEKSLLTVRLHEMRDFYLFKLFSFGFCLFVVGNEEFEELVAIMKLHFLKNSHADYLVNTFLANGVNSGHKPNP